SDCIALGFSNATLNICGYCVEGTTGLEKNYGKDCRGVCGGSAIIDCTNACAGQAFVDECTGKCIGGTSSRKEDNNQHDCRGLCLSSSKFEYRNDICGVCSKASGTFSIFWDCTNTCHLPGDHIPKAQLLCGQCVDGKSNISSSEVLDECGQCKRDSKPCFCNGHGQLDACGVCNGQGKSCVNLQSVSPVAALNMTDTTVMLIGAFKVVKGSINCVFSLNGDTDESNQLVTYVTGSGNGTVVSCIVKLPAGQYKVGVQLNRKNIFAANTLFLVYTDNVGYDDMTPSRAAYNGQTESIAGVTVTFRQGNVPNLPLYCLITNIELPSEKTVIEGNPDKLATCIIPYPSTSQNITVSPSLDGQNCLTKSFNFSFFAPPPKVRQAYIPEDGSAVVVIFDRPVEVSNLQDCSLLLSASTLQQLGEKSLCHWASQTQLVVFVSKQIKGNTVTVTLQSGVISEADQEVAEAMTSNLNVQASKVPSGGENKVMITGPSTVSLCGNFVLTAHFSSPKGGGTDFFWTVQCTDMQNVDQHLLNTVRGTKMPHLILEPSLLEANIIYEFIVSVRPPGERNSLQAYHSVTKHSFPAPLVTVYPSFLLSTDQLSKWEILGNLRKLPRTAQSSVLPSACAVVSQNFWGRKKPGILLSAEASFPDCIEKSQQIKFMWTVDNPRVKFDFVHLYSSNYRVAPYTLPEGQKVTFTVRSFLDRNQTQFTSSSVTLVTPVHQFKAFIQGTSSRIVGTQSGVMQLDGSGSSQGWMSLVYQWSCHTDDKQPCFNHKDMSSSSLLIPRNKQKQPILEINSKFLKAGEKLNFGLQVFNVSNHTQNSEIAMVSVTVVKGNIPQVVIQSVTVYGKPVMPDSNLFNVPAGAAVKVKATVTSYTIPIFIVIWNITDFLHSYGYSGGLRGREKGRTKLFIPEGTLVGHGFYKVTVTVCNKHGGCGMNNLTLYATPSVSLCQVKVKSFTALNRAVGWVYGCSIPLDKAPLTYQLYVRSQQGWVPVTQPQYSSVFQFFGPLLPENGVLVFGAEVCDKFNYCSWFHSEPVQVMYPTNITLQKMVLLARSKETYDSGNPIDALYQLSLATFALAENVTTKQVKTLVKYSLSALSGTLSTGNVLIVYNSMLPLLTINNTAVRLDAMMIIERITKKLMVKKVTHILPTVKTMFTKIVEVSLGDVKLMQQLTQTLGALLKVAAAVLTRGQTLELKSEHDGFPKAVLEHKVLDSVPVIVKGKHSNGEPVEAMVEFYKHVRNRFRHWPCGEWTCDGVVITMILYPSDSPYPDGIYATRLAPVVSIEMRTPGTGTVVPLSYNQFDTVLISMTKTHNVSTKGKLSVDCQFWDSSKRQWSRKGVISLGYSDGLFSCWSSHLSAFTMLEVSNRMTMTTIIGIAVASMMAFLIICILVILFVRKKQAKVSEVNSVMPHKVHQK
ncbi:uncharacterized protein LOC111087726, partial [Limulus polyphemus]|uniref:Uncharacterized protein LOC111087726 n=1 Tax=Limulus polyphemus TaxID=6850 RepID=A0ABM1T5A8_LIMPO